MIFRVPIILIHLYNIFFVATYIYDSLIIILTINSALNPYLNFTNIVCSFLTMFVDTSRINIAGLDIHFSRVIDKNKKMM